MKAEAWVAVPTAPPIDSSGVQASNTAPRHQAIRKALEARAGRDPDAKAMAEATVALWFDMSARLEPIIGSQGIDVLFARALHQAGTACPSFVPIGTRDGRAAPNGFEAADGPAWATAVEESSGLLAHFTELLESLIGRALAEQLLGPLWTASASVCEEEPRKGS